MSTLDRDHRRSSVRRTNVTACARCRSRKQRCDQNIPACSNCERAGVSCVSTDIDGKAAPRSYIKSLEDRIAFLENQIASQDLRDLQPSPAAFTGTSHSPGTSSLPRDPIDQVALHCFEPDAFFRSIVSSDGQSLLRSLLAEPLRSVSQAKRQSDHRALLEELPYETRAVLPGREAAGRLTDAYFEHTEFFSPIISSKEAFLTSLDRLYADAPGSASRPDPAIITTQFRAFAIFATSVLLLNRTDSSFPVSRAESYFATATRILAQNPAPICTGDMEHLCNLLLIIQYSCFASNLTAAWHFLGLASRLALELGLHDERAVAAKLERAQISQRRWLFWSLYTIERNLCVIIGRPFSIPDEAIQTPLPELQADDLARSQALHLITARQFESEIYTTLNQKPPVNGAVIDLYLWREGIRQRLIEWVEATPAPAAPSTQLAPRNIFEATLHNGLVLLYYPSPSFPNPSENDVLILAQSAAESITAYRLSFRDGQLRFFWRTVHNLFRSGVAMAYCVHVQATQHYPDLNHADMVASINTCTSILWAMVERYPPGRVYRDAFENLAQSVLKSVDGLSLHDQGMSQAAAFAYDPTALADMALPQTAVDTLYWGFGDLT